MKNKVIKLSLISIFSVVIVGCGGSGGSGGNGGSGGGNLAAINFPTDAVSAPATTETATDVAEVATNSLASGGGLNSVGTNDAEVNAGKLTDFLKKSFIKNIQKIINKDNYALNSAHGTTETEDCTNGGHEISTIHSLNYDDNENGTLEASVTYNNCQDMYGTENGSLYISATVIGGNFSVIEMVVTSKYTDMSNSNTDRYNIAVNTGSRFKITYPDPNNQKHEIIELTMTGTEDGKAFGYQNARFVIILDDLEMYTFIHQTQGRMYINELSQYVEYDTNYDMSVTPFKYAESDGVIMDGGIAKYIAGSDTLTVKAEAGVINVYKNDGPNPIAMID